ncbi:unnamed protein product [Clonostachys rosea]|uniref:Uncharacterized protein n=1 Tax=Bionectria ochroleuca TaxID=29856 RepID=A0ABY6U2K2_BIOOC|nr:unnamed protein product [Clonostachys rosea]
MGPVDVVVAATAELEVEVARVVVARVVVELSGTQTRFRQPQRVLSHTWLTFRQSESCVQGKRSAGTKVEVEAGRRDDAGVSLGVMTGVEVITMEEEVLEGVAVEISLVEASLVLGVALDDTEVESEGVGVVLSMGVEINVLDSSLEELIGVDSEDDGVEAEGVDDTEEGVSGVELSDLEVVMVKNDEGVENDEGEGLSSVELQLAGVVETPKDDVLHFLLASAEERRARTPTSRDDDTIVTSKIGLGTKE